jgi:hypothetical protein
MVYLALAVALLARQIAGSADPDTFRFVAACAGSFLIYFGAGFVAASLLNLPARGRLTVAYGLPCVLFLGLAAFDLVDKGPHGSGGFINLNFNYKTLWVLPGVLLNRPLQWRTAEIPAAPPQVVSDIHAALVQPDRSMVLIGILHENGVSAEWRVLAWLDAAGTIDRRPAGIALPYFDAIRPRADGSALASWRSDGKTKIGSLSSRGEVTPLFELSPVASDVFPNESEHVTDLAADTQGRLLLAGRFEKTPPPGAAFAEINYRVARFDAHGKLDRTFALTGAPRFFNEDIRVAAAADGSVLLAYGDQLQRLSADGKILGQVSLPGRAVDVFAHPDGPVLVSIGAALLRFDARLQPDAAFQARTAEIGAGFRQMRILAARPDGGVIVGLNSDLKSRLVYLAKDGNPMKFVYIASHEPRP